MSRLRRPFLALFLLLPFSATAWSRPPGRSGPPPSLAPASRLLSWLSAWGGLALSSTWLKEGSILDPFGRPQSSPPSSHGCSFGPDGRCVDDVTMEAGCALDREGRCAPGH